MNGRKAARMAVLAGVIVAACGVPWAATAQQIAPAAPGDMGASRGARLVSAQVDPFKRVALVIGVSQYLNNRSLPNPDRDAAAMAAQLRRMGFEVVHVPDARRMAMLQALTELRERLRGAAVGLVYFAGHGMEVDGRNFLIPGDVNMALEDDVRHNAVPLDAVLEKFGSTPAKLVILDACRDNPFARGGGGGLAPVDRAPEGTLIAYATSPRSAALDGQSGGNGLYTGELLRAMALPGATAEEVFKATRLAVATRSGGRQIPWESTSLTGTLVLHGGEPAKGLRVAAWTPAVEGGVSRGGGAPQPSAPATPEAVRYLGQAWRDCPTCPALMLVPAGEFLLGSPEQEAGRHPQWEGPVVAVKVPTAFALGQREVSLAEYRQCVLDAARPGDPPDLRCRHWPTPPDGAGAGVDLAASGLSWADAQAYVRWLSHRTGQRYLLPSEAQWEYAARAGTRTARPWGEALGHGLAVCRDCGDAEAPTKVAWRHPWGLQDMLGSVWEWTEDCRTDSLQARGADVQPASHGQCAERVVRGGSRVTAGKGVRSAARSFLPLQVRLEHVGFRVARELAPGELPR